MICAVLFPEKTYSPGLSGVVMEEKSVLGTSILLFLPSFPAVPQLKGFKDPHTSQKRPPRHLRHLDLAGVWWKKGQTQNQAVTQVAKIINNFIF